MKNRKEIEDVMGAQRKILADRRERGGQESGASVSGVHGVHCDWIVLSVLQDSGTPNSSRLTVQNN